ncbi:MAG: dienelactone hydrolase family protein [Alphaproteobacteria bacterium]|nr:dienelactone hydrolase family protein [Alphaproteobacteria bacterium]
MTKTPEIKSWKYYQSNPEKRPDCLIFMLHGCGGNADDILKLAPQIKKQIGNKNFVAVAPDAFLSSVEGNNVYQWFDIENNYAKSLFSKPYTDLSEQEKSRFSAMTEGENGMKAASETLNEFLDFCQKKFGLKDSQTVIFGYSQGAMQALDMGISRKKPVKSIVCVSGCLIPPDQQAIRKEVTKGVCPEILMLHGTKDNVIDINAAEQTAKALSGAGFKARLVRQNGLGHGRGQEAALFWEKAAYHTAKQAAKTTPDLIKTHTNLRGGR